MKSIRVELLRPGDVLGRAILSRSGLSILEEGTVFTEAYIKRMKELGITSVVVREVPERGSLGFGGNHIFPLSGEAANSAAEAMDSADVPDPLVRKQAMKELVALTLPEKIEGRLSAPLIEDRFKRLFRGIICDVSSHAKLIDQLALMLQCDRRLFDHSLNVAKLSAMLGVSRQFDNARLLDLTVGGLLFDIGMTRMPRSLIRATRRLSREERKTLENHAIEGYRIMIALDGVSTESAKCALLHHERYDGSGYPVRMSGGEIPEMAQIVAMADVFDALTSPRYHRQAYTENEAIEFLFGAGDRYFDAELVKQFVKHISLFPVSTLIKLSNGQIAEVASNANGFAHRPVVRVLREADGTRVRYPYELDLSTKRDVVVLHSCEGLYS
ncbi:MAG: HD domain-containing phosphohydrolase [Paenibacillus sp.]|uniref:HD-GYP domain-containing protein n=1 Tax=Paenibacillus sp. TaxID=58172 RepID=UPI002903B059|nr:HD domain-containing phosphohydrolase [Paenibacillus sp.]MDU2243072.1 HD domain-containing phosphohydrolase [Paenibacillus sp.]